LPGGVVNIVCGASDELACVLADHYDVNALWYQGSAQRSKLVEHGSAANLKPTWVNYGKRCDWQDKTQAEGEDYLRQAIQLKTIWAPYGE
jgi:aldehyde dehydrogenase (NAD+)